MKKLLLSIACISTFGFAYAQKQTGTPPAYPGICRIAAYDDFDTTVQYSIKTTERQWNMATGMPNPPDSLAYKGLFWTQNAGYDSSQTPPVFNGFYATKSRTGNGILNYTITQDTNAYIPFLVVFGSYADTNNAPATMGTFSLDLTANANLKFTVKNAGDSTIRFTVQVKDINGVQLVYQSGAVQGTFYNFSLGYSQRASAGIANQPLGPRDSANFSYDLHTAVVGAQPKNIVAPAGVSFDYAHVTQVQFTAVNNHANAKFAPYRLTNYPIQISNFRLGEVDSIPKPAPPVVVTGLNNNAVSSGATLVYPNPCNTGTLNLGNGGDLTYTMTNATGVTVKTGVGSKIDVSNLEKGMYMISTGNGKPSKVILN